MISGGNRILFTGLNIINPSKYIPHNPTWLKNSNFSQSKCLPTSNCPSNINKVLIDENESEDISINDNKPIEKSFSKPIVAITEIKTDPVAEKLVAMAMENDDDDDDNLKTSEILTVLTQLNIFSKKKKYQSTLKKRGYSTSEKFQNLCAKIKRSLNDFEVDELIMLLFVCKNFKLPENSLCSIEIMEKICKNKKKLNLSTMVLVYHTLLDQLENKEASEKLVVFKKQFESKLLMLAKEKFETNSVEDVVDLLANATKFPLPSKLKIVLLYSALDLGKEKWCEFNLTRNFLRLLNHTNVNDPDFPILEKKLFHILMECSNNSRFIDDIMNFINELSDMVCFKKIQYERELFDTLVDAVVKNNVLFSDKMALLNTLLTLRHYHQGFLEHILRTIQENPELVNENVATFLARILVVGHFHGKKNNLEAIFKIIDSMDYTSEEINLKHLHLLLYSLMLGHFPLKLMEKMSEKINSEEFECIKLSRWVSIIFSNAAINFWYPNYHGQFVSEEKINLAINKVLEEDKDIDKLYRSLKIKKLIESAVGIKNCVLNKCYTKHGLIIDQVMVLNEKGNPIRLPSKKSNEIFYIEDIFVPPGHNLVFISNFFHYMYFRNGYYLASKYMNKVKLLKELGIVIPCLFTTEKDDKMSYTEKGQFLFQQIKSKYLAKISQPSFTDIEKPVTIPHYPYFRHKFFNKIDAIIPSEKQWLEGFITTLEGQIWYTDGSLRSTGAGSGIYYPEGEFEISNSLDVDTSTDAEISGIKECAKEAYAFVKKNYGKDCKPVVNIVTDNQGVIKFLIEEHYSSETMRKECIEAVQNLSKVASVRLIWSPGHFGIAGNMMADALAKKGASVL